MTLTLYSLHVVMRTPGVWPAEEPSAYLSHVVVLLAIGAAFVLVGRRGPLEAIAGLPVRLARSADDRRTPGRAPESDLHRRDR